MASERRTTCTYHCATCDSHFSSLAAFDLHRQGSYEPYERHCVDPDDVNGDSPYSRLAVKTNSGYCDLKRGEPSESATIYQMEVSSLTEFHGPQGLTEERRAA